MKKNISFISGRKESAEIIVGESKKSISSSLHLRLTRFLSNYVSTLLIFGAGIIFYTKLSHYHIGLLDSRLVIGWSSAPIKISTPQIFYVLFIIYTLLLIPYYGLQPRLQSKASIFFSGLLQLLKKPKEFSFSWPFKQACLCLLLKFFFVPLMINWSLGHFAQLDIMLERFERYYGPYQTFRVIFDDYLYWTCFQLILMVDTLIFTIGYMVELPFLNNRIRSVEPTILGWMACLICYPPFNGTMAGFIHWQSSDFPDYADPILHVVMNCCILVAMAIYSTSSIMLGLRASNLTNRGIVTRGPYAFVRHPAYTAKNLAWWIGAVPTLALSFNKGLPDFSWALFCLSFWSGIYILRAVTEEEHLLRGHNGYSAYMQRVPWRFIPGIL